MTHVALVLRRPPIRHVSWAALAVVVTVGVVARALPARAAGSFTTFESGQVRPLAMSPDGSRLFAVNTPDNRLEIFSIGAGGALTHTGAVEVGLEPVSVAARNNSEVWVVNHLSDSVSIVDVSANPARVTRTLLLGDEPRDIVFAGSGGNRAFITCAHRGQNRPGDPQLTTPGVGRADVWVFDANNLGATLGGTSLTIVTLFGDTPRALATDGNNVYAAVFHSGNRTTVVSEQVVCNGGAAVAPCNVNGTTYPGGLPAPNTNVDLVAQPEVGLIVKFDPGSSQWRDQLGRNWNNAVRFSLPDQDVFKIDANANPPVQTASFATVGTVLFNMVVHPTNGKVYVTNTDAKNEVRFEGPGVFGGTTVRGHLHESRVTVLDGASVLPRHLNKHLNYSVVPSPATDKAKSLAIPVGAAVSSDGTKLYVAGFGSSKVGVFNTAQIEADTFVPDSSNLISVTGGGPSGLVFDGARNRLYVMTRFDDSISVIDTTVNTEIAHVPLYNPEPAFVRNGRPVLYDAQLTSSNGETSCAACHVFGDFDSLAWDLGNPDDSVLNDPNPQRVGDPLGMSFVDFHPMKGPMTTQSLRGMAHSGPMHWRGDRTGGNDPGGSSFDEDAAFKKFIVAFEGLLGRNGPISNADMQRFTDFILDVSYPPNPIRALDNSLTPDQSAGRTFFLKSQASDVFQPCHGCHVLDPSQGFFGTDGFSTFEFETQFFKIAHLRNAYQKIGMFGMPSIPFLNSGNNGNQGPQVRGFGFLHDGSIDTVLRFLNSTVFNQTNAGGLGISNPGGFANGAAGDPVRRQVEAFTLAFDSDLAPVVGQQITRSSSNAVVADPRVDLLVARAAAGECDLVVKGSLAGQQRGWVRLATGMMRSDRASEAEITEATLRGQAATLGQERTYTCVPPGSGHRIGVDRDEDGALDRTELDAGTDPADPSSCPGCAPVQTIRSSSLTLRDDAVPPLDGEKRSITFRSSGTASSPAGVYVPAAGGAGDPTVNGALLTVYNANGLPDNVQIALPAANWKASGPAGAPRAYRYRDSKRLSGPIQAVALTARSLTVRGKGSALYPLVSAPQGSMAVRVTMGTEIDFCAQTPARATGNPPSTASNDTTAKFNGQRKAPPPAVCPTVPGAGSASWAFLEPEGFGLLD